MKKSFLLMGLSVALLAGCGETSSSVDTNTSSTSTSFNSSESSSSSSTSSQRKNMLKEALKKDYSNMTLTVDTKIYNDLLSESELESWTEYYYNDYTVVSFTKGDDTMYSYYHEYNNESYLYFTQEKNNDKSKAGWLNKGWKDSTLALGYTYFDFNDVLKLLDPDDVAYLNNTYVVNDKAKCQEMASDFLGKLNSYSLDISNIQFTVSDNGYLTRIVGLVDASDDESDYIDINLFNFGSTTFDDSMLPDAPTSTNVIEYWQYKGWDGPWVDKYVNEITISFDGNVKTEEGYDAVLELDDELTIKSSLSPTDYNVEPSLTWVSTTDAVNVESGNKQHTGKLIASKGGEAEVYATYVIDKNTTITSNKLKVKVNGIPEQNKADAIYDFAFNSVSSNGEVIATNKVTNTKPYEITTTNPSTGKVYLNDGKNSDGAYEKGEKAVILSDGGQSTTYSLDSFVQFNFGEQQVSSISLYYAMFFDHGFDALAFMSKCAIETSNDGTNWESIDIKDEVKENISYKHKNLLEKSFAPASYVRIAVHSSMVGKGLSFAVSDIAFMANDDCNNYLEPSEKVNVESVVISQDTTEAYVGKTIQFAGKVNPSNASKPQLTWFSSNEEVATIDTNGLLTGLKAGKTEVYAMADGVSSSHVEITIKDYPTLDSNIKGQFKGEYNYKTMLLDFVDNSLTIEFNDKTYSLTYTDYQDSNLASDRYFIFTDANNDNMYVRYSSDQLKFYGNLDGSKINYSEFNKYVAASKIVLSTDKTEFKYGVDKSFTVKASFNPSNATGLGVKELTWFSSNTSVLEVSDTTATANIVTIKGVGTATIIATNGDDVMGRIAITVKEKTLVNTLTLESESGEVEVGSTLQINASVNEDADVKDLVYESKDKKIATVSSTGLITGVKEGSTTISVKTTDGSNLEKTFTVTVKASTSTLPFPVDGNWTGYDDYEYCPTTLMIASDGKATLTVNYDEEIFVGEFTYKELVEDGNGKWLVFGGTMNGETATLRVNNGSSISKTSDIKIELLNENNEAFTIYSFITFGEGSSFCVFQAA